MSRDPAASTQAIDRALGCQHCGEPLAGSPSDDFCGETCQEEWHRAQAAALPVAGPAAPDETLPETTPVRSLGWLGPPPPGTILRAGHEVLDTVTEFVSRFSVFPSEHCAPTLALWYAHTHATDLFYVTPRLILDSAEPGSGKTRILEVAQYLVAAPEMTISATTAALFRLVAAGPITILFDEVDTIFNQSGGYNEDLRGLLNAGYKRSATIARCVGDARAMKVERFPVYAPAALAGIAGAMPSTITTRAITIHMRRRRADEPVEPFRERTVARLAEPIREELAAWINRAAQQIGQACPAMPDGVTDRAAEIWEPLLALADAAGEHWPDTARAACRHFVLDTGPQVTSLGVRLLADLRHVFTQQRTDRMATADILAALVAIEESSWDDLHGRALDSRRLGKELARYGVKPRNVKIGGTVVKGYRADGDDGLADAWSRYLSPAATTATAATAQVRPVADEDAEPPASATAATRHADQVAAVADNPTLLPPAATGLTSEVAAVAAVAADTSPPPRPHGPEGHLQ